MRPQVEPAPAGGAPLLPAAVPQGLRRRPGDGLVQGLLAPAGAAQPTDHAGARVFVNKIIANLQLRSECTRVNEKSLALFADLAGGYCSGKLLLKLDAVHYMLRHHTADDFPFLQVPGNVRLRTLFYSTLCKLLFLDDANIKFKVFMEPFTRLLRSLKEQDDVSFASPPVRAALVGVLRDLRGIVSACSNRRTYALFFDWVYPAFTPLFQRAVAVYYGEPEVTTPLLKLYAELVYNKAQRLTFDSSSPNGILLFRDASAILVATARASEEPLPPGVDPYTRKYKGVSICMLLLTRALSGITSTSASSPSTAIERSPTAST